MDVEKELSCQTIYKQLTNYTDLLATLDLAPPTKKTMMWKEWGAVDKLLSHSSQPMIHAQLQKVNISSLWCLCPCVGCRIPGLLQSWDLTERGFVDSEVGACCRCALSIALLYRSAGHLMVCTLTTNCFIICGVTALTFCTPTNEKLQKEHESWCFISHTGTWLILYWDTTFYFSIHFFCTFSFVVSFSGVFPLCNQFEISFVYIYFKGTSDISSRMLLMDLERFTAAVQLHHLESSCRITTCSLRRRKLQMFLSFILSYWLASRKMIQAAPKFFFF